MKQTVIGLFNKSADAQDAVQRLLSNGFTNANVDISLGTTSDTSGSTNFNLDHSDTDEHESGISRFFKNLFGDNDNDVNKYSNASRGKSIVTVHATSEEEAQRAADILDDAGATDVDENADDYSYGTSGAAPVGAFNETTGMSATPSSTADTTSAFGTTGTGAFDTDTDDSDITSNRTSDITGTTGDDITGKSIPVIEENIEVGKRTVQTGGVRVRSRIVERPVEEEVRLRTERVYVQRNPVNRPASDTDFDNFKEGVTEITEQAEVPMVNKEARVVEEISLGKDVDTRTETVRDTVRKTEVDIDDLTNKTDTTSTNSWSDKS